MRFRVLALFMGVCLMGAISHVGTDTIGETTSFATSVSLTAAQAPTNGDLILIHIIAASSGLTFTGPTGYNCSAYKITSTSGGDSYAACYHIASSSESASLGTFTASSSSKFCYSITEWSGVNSTTPFSGGPFQGYSLSGSTSITISYSAPLPSPASISLWGFASGGNFSSIQGGGWTTDLTHTGSECPSQVTTHPNSTISTSGSVQVNWSGNFAISGFLMEITPTGATFPGDPSDIGIWRRFQFLQLLERGY